MTLTMNVPRMPALTCPDRGGRLPLCVKPREWPGASQWAYLCEKRPWCRGLMTAHPDGRPTGVPAPQAVRTARRHVHAVFDPLWQSAERMYVVRERSAEGEARAIAKIRGAARTRAYQFVAAALGMSEEDCHISKIDDIDVLRRFYRAAKAATPEMVGAWAKAQRGGA